MDLRELNPDRYYDGRWVTEDLSADEIGRLYDLQLKTNNNLFFQFPPGRLLLTGIQIHKCACGLSLIVDTEFLEIKDQVIVTNLATQEIRVRRVKQFEEANFEILKVEKLSLRK